MFVYFFIRLRFVPNRPKHVPKSAIQVRNRSIVDQSDLVICCIQHKSGGAYATIHYAKKQGKKTINLADEN